MKNQILSVNLIMEWIIREVCNDVQNQSRRAKKKRTPLAGEVRLEKAGGPGGLPERV